MNNKQLLKRSLSLLCLSVLLLVSCKSKDKSIVSSQEEIQKVNVKQVFETDVDQIGTFTATVKANITNNIAPKIGMRISKMFVEVGDHVRKGQKLAIMDEATLVQAKFQNTNDSIELSRTKQLYEVGGTSKSEYDARKLAYNISKTNYINLLENTVLLSPISGVVTARNYDKGDMYSGAQAIYTIEQITPVKLKVNVSEGLFTNLKKGMSVEVKCDVYGDKIFNGKVSLIYPTIDPATRTFPVEVIVANSDEKVRPGMFARVTFTYGTQKHVVVPDMSIVKQAGSGDRYVYVVNNNKVEFKKVNLGRRLGTEYEIVDGLASGDYVVVGGQSRLTNGSTVEIVNGVDSK